MSEKALTLEERILALENHFARLAGLCSATATFVNILLDNSGLSHEELNAALTKATQRRAEEKSVQPEEAGSTVDNHGDSNSGVSGDESTRDVAGGNSLQL